MPDVKDVVSTFFVADVRKAVDWYERVLGFKTAFIAGGPTEPAGYAGVELGPARIHLGQIEVKKPGLVYKGACYLRLNSGVDQYVAAPGRSNRVLAQGIE